jgi:hypothetical protein
MEQAGHILLGGAVVPVTGPPAEAVAVAGDRIIAVGSQAGVRAPRPRHRDIDLRGASLGIRRTARTQAVRPVLRLSTSTASHWGVESRRRPFRCRGQGSAGQWILPSD